MTAVRRANGEDGHAKLERRVDRLAAEVADHKGEDQNQFGQLRADIAAMGDDLGRRIDAVASDVSALQLDKAKAEGRAEGAASVKAAIAQPRWWHGLAVTLGGVLVAGLLAVIGWLIAHMIDGYQAEIDALRNRPVAAVTVTPAQAVSNPQLPAPP